MPLRFKRRWFLGFLPLLFGAAVLLYWNFRPALLPDPVSRINAASLDAEAKYRLGLRYLNGPKGSKDLNLALKWIREAASENFADAQFLMGNFSAHGIGVEKNEEAAIQWYAQAAANGHRGAQYGLEAPPLHFHEKSASESPAVSNSMETAAGPQRLDPIFRDLTPGDTAGDRTVFDIAQPIVKRRPAPPLPIRTGETLRISGTGFFITPRGHIVTCRHILSGAQEFRVGYENRLLPATLTAFDEARDLALLKVEGSFPALPIDFDQEKGFAETVYTLGFPNSEIQGLRPKLTQGIINSPTGFRDDPAEYQISVSVQPGNSGGPLFDRTGRVIGVVTSRLDDLAVLRATGYLPQNVNYAIKSSVLRDFLKQQPEGMDLLPASEFSPAERDLGEMIRRIQSALVYIIVDARGEEDQRVSLNFSDNK